VHGGGEGERGQQQRLQANALHLHRTLPLQCQAEVDMRVFPGAALTSWRSAAAPLEDVAQQICGDGANRIEGLCQGLLSRTHRLALCHFVLFRAISTDAG